MAVSSARPPFDLRVERTTWPCHISVGFSTRRLGFDLEVVHVGFMVGRVALGQVYRLVAYFDLFCIHS